jgi:hypothetical protein
MILGGDDDTHTDIRNNAVRAGSPAFPGEEDEPCRPDQSRNAKYASCGDWSQSNDGQRCRFLDSAYSVACPSSRIRDHGERALHPLGRLTILFVA